MRGGVSGSFQSVPGVAGGLWRHCLSSDHWGVHSRFAASAFLRGCREVDQWDLLDHSSYPFIVLLDVISNEFFFVLRI